VLCLRNCKHPKMLATVQITGDAEKLWKCAGMLRKHPQYVGKTPSTAGESLRIYTESAKPSPFCDAPTCWRVFEEDAHRLAPWQERENYWICQHQVDAD
jgi:hypothetical protein